MTADQVALAFRSACLTELEAIKPGNVHIFADGHGMVVQDFVRSAEAAADVIAQPELSVGERILAAVEATHDAVQCNTNLGIILLCAPLVQAVFDCDHATFRARLASILENLTVDDAEKAYRAILLASPAGLGVSAHHDVRQPPAVTLLDAMREASLRDDIALQYVNNFAGIFDSGLVRFQQMLSRWQRPAWAVTAVYLGFLASHEDSHILRKYGYKVAAEVRQQALVHEQAFIRLENPRTYLGQLLKFDADLKQRNLNPGTSADLTVASLFVAELQKTLT